jgi:hypothetical protein
MQQASIKFLIFSRDDNVLNNFLFWHAQKKVIFRINIINSNITICYIIVYFYFKPNERGEL